MKIDSLVAAYDEFLKDKYQLKDKLCKAGYLVLVINNQVYFIHPDHFNTAKEHANSDSEFLAYWVNLPRGIVFKI